MSWIYDEEDALFENFYSLVTRRAYALSQVARTHVDGNGAFRRGAFLISVERHELCNRRTFGFPWISQDTLNKKSCTADLTDCLSEYDPQKEFLFYITIGISTSRRRRGENDAISRICTCQYKLVPDENEKLCRMVHASSVNALGNPPRMCGNSSCSNSDVTSDLKSCSVCRCVDYCSRKCQKLDWKARHKEICKKVAADVRKGKKQLGEKTPDKKKDPPL
jgi:hypothetical protein